MFLRTVYSPPVARAIRLRGRGDDPRRLQVSRAELRHNPLGGHRAHGLYQPGIRHLRHLLGRRRHRRLRSWHEDAGSSRARWTSPAPGSVLTAILYHGAPWIEFDVDWTKLASTAGEPAPMAASSEVAAEASAEVSTTSELASLVSVMCAVMLVTAALALSIGRRRDL